MKRILVIGKSSYVGTSFMSYLQTNNEYIIDVTSSRENLWKEIDFSKYDVVFNVAGIAHVRAKKSLENLYYQINRDLPISIANKAKAEGVKQFIHMSSMIVYGDMSRIGFEKNINKNYPEAPNNFYGDSKLQADQHLSGLADKSFKVALIRAPLVYNENAQGNFPKLLKVATLTPFFPNIKNKQSMIYIDNLCEFLKRIIDEEIGGIFHPQNKEYVCISDLVSIIAANYGKKVKLIKIFNPFLKWMSNHVSYINKAFGNITYEKSMSNYWDWSYCIVDFEESIKRICYKRMKGDNNG